MRKFFATVMSLLTLGVYAQQTTDADVLPSTVVPKAQMEAIYQEAKTPYKYGLVVAPTDNYHKIDCPTVFREADKWYMTYVVYDGKAGTDGRGYETWMAESDNLLEWKTLGRILSFRDGAWDCNQRGGFPALPDMEWGGSYTLQTYKGKHWMTYIGGEGSGYEAIKAPLHVGLAWTDKPINVAHEWESATNPILSIHDKDAQWWEKLTQYKSIIYRDSSKQLGKEFVMFYNAGGKHPDTGLKGERVGIALSKDMKKWKRYAGNPVFAREAEGIITGDAHLQKMDDLYVMFYFSAFDPSRPYKAHNTFAASYDLINWTDWQGDDLIVPSKPYDELFAHKSYVVKHEGIVYHFYCAVNNAEQRGIAVATSKPMGKSVVNFPKPEGKKRRILTELEEGWKTWLIEKESDMNSVKVKDSVYTVKLPHNWDDYYGYRQLTHGNLHGSAIYEKEFYIPEGSPVLPDTISLTQATVLDALNNNRRYFLRFEGVGTYANVILNGKELGRHPVGRTTLTLNISDALQAGWNKLTVKAEHPEMIADMPWVCGGCSSEWGFSEGSQPLGIFRPVIIENTDLVRVEPFGVHIWHDDEAKRIFIETEVKNYDTKPQTVEFVNKFSNADGRQVFRLVEQVTLQPGEMKLIRQESPVENPIRWSTENPYLYQLATMIKRGGKTTDEVSTPFGIRTISWPIKRNDGDGRFFLNEKPIFLNGVCEYEHQFGQSHAFSKEQVKARVKQMLAAGFNAFRDAHQPHHLDYQAYWDQEGILFWTQLSAHVWYDTPEFRHNFKQLLRQWVKERRNSPSVVMWGLQNESTLPKEFAEECSAIIREMDPTAHTMRVITTCNGGEGSDWNVVQNWSGTYGGNLYNYGKELSQPDQLLNGEYGAWRSLDLHTEPGEFEQNGVWSEERMCILMEAKIRLAEAAKDSLCGQFQWIYSSHDNPGRRQPDEAYRLIDKVGPFNYKGLVTPWEEPLDVYYMYKANYIPASKEPMVYLASHTWADRFVTGARKATVEAYSNCDSVLLYNDAIDAQLLGCLKQPGIGNHFVFEDCDVRYNVLRAVGYYQGKAVAEDLLVLSINETGWNGSHGSGRIDATTATCPLEIAPHFSALYEGSSIVPIVADNYAARVDWRRRMAITPQEEERAVKFDVKGLQDTEYLYRINCGGDSYTDSFGQTWLQDNRHFSTSWADDFCVEGDTLFTSYQASQRRTNDPIRGTRDWELFQTFRFGRHRLSYKFPVEKGVYRVELYFAEPWHGTGGSAQTDCEGIRLFDVAINGKTVLNDIDLWAEAGHDGALKRVIEIPVTSGELTISFPEVKAGQAIISAIAIAQTEKLLCSSIACETVQKERTALVERAVQEATLFSWKAQSKRVVEKMPKEWLPEDKNARPNVTYEAEAAIVKGKFTKKEHRAKEGVFFGKSSNNSITWEISTGLAQVYALRFKYMNDSGAPVKVRVQLIDSKDGILKDDEMTLGESNGKWRMVSTTTGGFINAGYYRVLVTGADMNQLAFEALDVQ